MQLEFAPNFATCADVEGVASIADLERERGVYSATPRFVREHCGDIARAILAAVPDAYYAEAERLKLYPNCDVRIHRLYPGDFPAYPGWHCDGEFRETYFSQPDLDRIPVSHHITACVGSHESGVSTPEFLAQGFRCDVGDAIDVALWGQVDRALQKERPLSLHPTRARCTERGRLSFAAGGCSSGCRCGTSRTSGTAECSRSRSRSTSLRKVAAGEGAVTTTSCRG